MKFGMGSSGGRVVSLQCYLNWIKWQESKTGPGSSLTLTLTVHLWAGL